MANQPPPMHQYSLVVLPATPLVKFLDQHLIIISAILISDSSTYFMGMSRLEESPKLILKFEMAQQSQNPPR